jgi:hypothetical protein
MHEAQVPPPAPQKKKKKRIIFYNNWLCWCEMPITSIWSLSASYCTVPKIFKLSRVTICFCMLVSWLIGAGHHGKIKWLEVQSHPPTPGREERLKLRLITTTNYLINGAYVVQLPENPPLQKHSVGSSWDSNTCGFWGVALERAWKHTYLAMFLHHLSGYTSKVLGSFNILYSKLWNLSLISLSSVSYSSRWIGQGWGDHGNPDLYS